MITDQHKKYGKVAVMFGGNSAEREVSLKSGQAVLNSLRDSGVDAYGFDPSVSAIGELSSQDFNRVVIVLHGRGGEDGSMQGALQCLDIPFSGSGVLGSSLAMDKIRSKQVWLSCGLPTAKYAVVEKSHFDGACCDDIIESLGGVVMVKPSQEGSSIGMAKVATGKELCEAIENAFQYDEQVLLEQFIEGDEYTVSILNGEALPSIKMSTPRVFYDYEAKYQADTTEYFCPSGLPAEEEKHLATISLQAFKAVAGSGWGRIDFMRDKQGKFYLLEANTVPGMTEKSLVPMAAKQAGYSFEALSLAILDTSFT